jgi:benzoyl-CoA reductase/2-hydroxyglutaryl-CoA dehydratase subunit BcrC/BadD/HgdB
VEVVLAAGMTPVDLNNRFITHPDPAQLVSRAEEAGLARTLCAWIKGMFAWVREHPEVGTLIGVTQGDCSNTHALMELWSAAGRRVIPFDYPYGRGRSELARQIELLAQALGADLEAAEQVRQELLPLRRDLARLDELTWREGKVGGRENHLWLVGASDFEGDPEDYHHRLREFLAQAQARPARGDRVRLGLLGVPTVFSDLYEVLERLGADVVYNEVSRQFAMPPPDEGADHSLVDQYHRYTYPYDIFGRIDEIQRECRRRGLHGVIHYTQAFCYRQMQDILLRRNLGVPVLTLEGDHVGPVDGRTLTRLEAFVEILAFG